MRSVIPAVARLGVGILALGCWTVMFLAGNDVWNDTGRLEIWTLDGPPFADLRAFLLAYYLLLPLILVDLVLSFLTVRGGSRRGIEPGLTEPSHV
ncbi:MAG: hypothetical protein U0794_09470 [Isosphaeraceae bacterium]